jgi:Ca-activated chloride channel family protein
MKIARAFLCVMLAVAGQAGAIDIWIDRPSSTDFVYGEVDFEAAIEITEGSAAVEFFVDGVKMAELFEPPYRVKVEVGFENVEHEFKVVARSADGQRASRVIVTAALHVDEIVEVELQQLYVTVGEGDRRVLDLDRDEFRIFDEGKRQEIVTFERGDVPLTATLLLDCSVSMEKGDRLAGALAGAQRFVEAMNPLDRANVVLFSGRLLRASDFTDDQAVLQQSLDNVEAVGGTAINDHLFLSLANLEKEQGRRVVVALSDGEDVHSVLKMREVVEKARSSQALIYWIFLREPGATDEIRTYTTSWRDAEANRAEAKLLRRAIRESGGRIEIVESLEEIDDAFVEIMAELREQYVIGYYPSEDRADGSWHDVKVRVARTGLAVRTREGYLDY